MSNCYCGCQGECCACACMCVNMLSAGSSQSGVDQREACVVLVPRERTSHLKAGSTSPVDVTRMVRGGWLCKWKRDRDKTETERDSVCICMFVGKMPQ